MKTHLRIALVSAFALALAACGSATDASEEAVADNVEMPADSAMGGTPMPVEDANAAMDENEMDAMEAADAAEAMVEEDQAETPADTAAEVVAE